jgi:hypothetical protein
VDFLVSPFVLFLQFVQKRHCLVFLYNRLSSRFVLSSSTILVWAMFWCSNVWFFLVLP